MDGWVRVNRKIIDNWLWEDKPFSRGQAWIDLIMMANHKDNKFPFCGEVVMVQRGSLVTSELKLMNRWGWSKSKVRLFLNLLQNDAMIVKITDRKKTTINIVNYSVYQDIETTEEPKKNRKKTDSRPIKDTNNNENNDNNILSKDNKRFVSDDELNQSIMDFIEYRKKKAPMTDKAIKLMIAELNKLSSDTKVQVAIINQSILNGWRGVFALKQDNKPQPQQQPKTAQGTNKFNQFPQRQYTDQDYEAIEKRLLSKPTIDDYDVGISMDD